MSAQSTSAAAVLRVVETRTCSVTQRDELAVEERRDRGVSRGLLIAGGVLGGLGTMLLIDPGESCKGEEMCVYDQRAANQATGALFLAVGAGLALSSMATIKHEKSLQVEAGPLSQRAFPHCVENPGARLALSLQWSDGTRVGAVTDDRGMATVPVREEQWQQGPTLHAMVFVHGRRVNDIVLTRAP